MTKIAFSVFFLFLNFSSAIAEEAKPFSVVLDAGHGGNDLGIQAAGKVEKDLALKFAQLIESNLQNKPALRVVLTRKGDYALSFDERRRIANTHTPAVFLSLHFGVHPRIYFLPPEGKPKSGVLIPLEEAHEESVTQSVRFGGELAESLKPLLPGIEVGSAAFPLVTLVGIQVPAVLMELSLLESDETLALQAAAIAEAVDRFVSGGKNPPDESPTNEIPAEDGDGPSPDHD